MNMLSVPFLFLLIRCSQAAREEEANETAAALRTLGGKLQRSIASAHTPIEAQKDPGLNFTVQQSVTVRDGGSGLSLQRKQSVSNGNDVTQSTIQAGGPGALGGTPVARASVGARGSTWREQLLRDRSLLGPEDADENDEKAETRAWNPDAICDGISARAKADEKKVANGLTEWQARRAVMSEYSRKFLSWNPYLRLSARQNIKAEEKAKSLVATGLTLDSARQLVMWQYSDKFSFGGSACAFVVDGGSSGGRLYHFTELDFNPDPIEVPLTCGNGAQGNGITAFSGGNTSSGKVLRFRDVIGAQALVPPEDIPEWFKDEPLQKQPQKLVDCYTYSLAKAIKSQEHMCRRSSLFIGVTAGFRDYVKNNTEEKQQRIRTAVDFFNLMLRDKMRLITPSTKTFGGGLQVLSIQREGSMEAQSVQLAAQVSGDEAVKNAIGVFSMGGKSAQFTSYKSERYTLLLEMGHLKGLQILQRAVQDKVQLDDIEGLRGTMVQYLMPILDKAKEDRDAPSAANWHEFTDGLWIGIQGTAWLAKYLGILVRDEATGLERHDPVPANVVRDEINGKLTSHDWTKAVNSTHEFRDLAQMLIVDFWLRYIFTDKTYFYFRKEWATESDRRIAAEWTFAAAQNTQPLIMQALQDEADADQDG